MLRVEAVGCYDEYEYPTVVTDGPSRGDGPSRSPKVGTVMVNQLRRLQKHYLLALPVLIGVANTAIAAGDAHGDDHGGGKGGLLDTDPGMALWTIILFVFLVVFLGKVAWPAILSGLEGRENRIRDDLTKADEARQSAEDVLKGYENKLAEAQEEARRIVDETRQDAEKLRARLVAETDDEIAKIRERAAAEIELAKQQALEDIVAQTSELAVMVAGQILKRQVDTRDTQTLINQSLDALKAAPANN